MNSPNKQMWLDAINDELKSHEERNTWDLVDISSSIKPIGSKWAFKIKRDSQGKLLRFRVRLVAQGFSQQHGIDYDQTYAPVANFDIFRLLLAISVQFKWHTAHFDIKCAFLYGELEETIHMKLPPGIPNNILINKTSEIKSTHLWPKTVGKELEFRN